MSGKKIQCPPFYIFMNGGGQTRTFLKTNFFSLHKKKLYFVQFFAPKKFKKASKEKTEKYFFWNSAAHVEVEQAWYVTELELKSFEP